MDAWTYALSTLQILALLLPTVNIDSGSVSCSYGEVFPYSIRLG